MADLPPIENITGVVLAGGKSSRMGTDKALARMGQETLVERCVATMAQCFRQNILIANRAEPFAHLKLPVYGDEVPDLGPLGGIHTGLRHAETPAVFVVACDMPFLDADLIREMALALGDFDAVAARIEGKFEPLHAGYQRRILPTIESRIQSGDYSVNRLLGLLRVRAFTEAELDRHANWRRTFLNVNTPEELERARKLA
jgi:molybdopterin-guanine dinucleotide biosynthesis protein A